MRKTILLIFVSILLYCGPVRAIPIGNNVEYIPAPRNLGINVLAPDAKLDVDGQVKIRGGSPQNGFVLTTDATGLATWQPIPTASSSFNNATLSGTTTFAAGSIVTGDIQFQSSVLTGLNAINPVTTGLLSAENINATGLVESSGGFSGDGSLLTDLSGAEVQGAVGQANSLTAGASVDLATTQTDILALSPSATANVNDTTGINPSNSLMRVQGDGAAVDLAGLDPQIALGSVDGQLLILRGMHDTNTVTINNGPHVVLNYGVKFIIGKRDTISFIYDAVSEEWIETSRTDVPAE